MQNLVISVSGGRSSVYMAYHILNSEKYKDFNKLFVFANTSLEHPNTIQFLKDFVHNTGVDLHVIQGVYTLKSGIGVRSKRVCLDTLQMKGLTFVQMIMHVNKHIGVGLPSTGQPYSSEYLKKRVIDHYSRQFFKSKFVTAIGYRYEDVPKRVTFSELRQNTKKICPLLSDFYRPISVFDLNHIYKDLPFRLDLPKHLGNCVFCYKKSDDGLAMAFRDYPQHIPLFSKLEKRYNYEFFRAYKNVDYFIEASKRLPLNLFEVSESDSWCDCSL